MNKTLSDLSMCSYDILEELKHTDIFQKLLASLGSLEHIEMETNQFKQAKKQYHPQNIEMKDLRKNLTEAKTTLYQTDAYKHHLEAEKAFQRLLNDMINRVGETISPYIKTPLHKPRGGSCGIH